MGKPLKKLKQGQVLFFEGDVQATVESVGQKQVLLSFLLPYRMSFFTWLNQYGHMPLPPYIHRNKRLDMDKDRYQTVFASKPGAVAAPTAALHFSEESFNTLAKKGVENVKLSLHVGAGTFQPVQCEDLTKHPMHKEWFNLSHQGAYQLNKSVRRRICVGTTCCRTLESIADPLGRMKAQKGWTDIFIYPGYSFKFVDALLTNFHLPGSTLLMLVCALGGYDLIMQAYQKAIDEGFRFYSYGDAMLIL